jgi:hypothetical protein
MRTLRNHTVEAINMIIILRPIITSRPRLESVGAPSNLSRYEIKETTVPMKTRTLDLCCGWCGWCGWCG